MPLVMVHFLFSTTAALLMVMALRIPVRTLFGARVAYAGWIIVPLVIAGAVLPVPEGLRSTLPVSAPHWVAETQRYRVDLQSALFGFWAVGAATFASILWAQQRAFARSLRPLRPLLKPVDRGLWSTSAVALSPVVIGTFRPRIVLPADFGERYTSTEQQLVIAHERMHIDRHDPEVNLFVAILRAVFWFHPLVHLAARYLRIDQELACDAAVVAKSPACRFAYAKAILKTQLVGTVPMTGCAWESTTAALLERRFTMLKRNFPGRSRQIAGAALVALATLTAAGMACAAQPAPPVRIVTFDDLLDDLLKKSQRLAPPRFLVDGEPTSRPPNELIGQISLAMIERIEVLPLSAEHPPTINIVLRH